MIRLDERRTSVPKGPVTRPRVRNRDRRAGIAPLLASLANHLRSSREVPPLRDRFEAGLKDLLHVQLVSLCDTPAGHALRPAIAEAAASDRVCVQVPVRQGDPPVRLETVPAPEARLDAWDHQVLNMAADLATLVVELDHLRATPATGPACALRAEPPTPALIGSSSGMTALREHIHRVAATDFTVLVQGESGTGKELVARQIHNLSRRRAGPFIAVNCAAIVESLLEAELFGIEDRTATGVRGRRGKFEHADGGTLFLDEVSDLAPAAQAKLLRAIQGLSVERVGGHASRRVDARIVVATNKSLRDLAARGLFREDLYYRLCGVELHVPPLRSRREDIPELARHFLSRYKAPRPLALSPDAAEAMRAYDWPGNVRELERLIEGAVTLARSEWITLEDLPPALRGDAAEVLLPPLARDDSMRAWGARYARLVLERCGHNKRQACRRLNISYHTLQAYLRWRPAEHGEIHDGALDPPAVVPASGTVELPAGAEGTMCG